ncbi:hypothetical protein CEUSTIGMA_g6930.t1 [Chlamydomonas eustigma]|uniref:Uncharacterized protein n=1 Tax=Chlamydomonas eustigma TaxID=1157962 RepID=A0A250X9A5_9CHLO|nr:hypothetical protein CEUSTIGMA_g6930.t1 [Chlamydomonas eustigma]|eukprot:GAX79489.1 hypothetical protein CEUSTIGMA_g6930.t1 [Chlamydomonas eustigma]
MMFEDERSPHPYTNFNKQPQDAPTLVGNWQEERAMKEATGITRYEPWTERGGKDRSHEFASSIYTARQDTFQENQTFTRTIENFQQLNPANWESAAHSAHTDPKLTKRLLEYRDVSKLGPRERKLMEEMMQEADKLPASLEYALAGKNSSGFEHYGVPQTLDSTYRAHFEEKDMTGLLIGTRVIKDRDGRPAVRDPTFLAETQMMQKRDADRILKKEALEAGATATARLADPDVPITLYTEAVAKGTYTDSITGTRTMSKVSPFNKYTNFSKPMSEYNKVVVDE